MNLRPYQVKSLVEILIDYESREYILLDQPQAVLIEGKKAMIESSMIQTNPKLEEFQRVLQNSSITEIKRLGRYQPGDHFLDTILRFLVATDQMADNITISDKKGNG